ncbi:MAG: bifunctional folylpolyglutamate synthase/dihydrofolate synthase [archaeon]|nr:bifunctional folylpolyglutamate synthase/dihydrofolate synthase [archaeon]
MNIEEELKWLYGLNIHRVKLDLQNISKLLNELGNPQNSFKSIHVAGTDGKGSTCAMIASVFNCSKIKTGLYTSPHILSFNERISVDGLPIDNESLARLISIVKPIVEDMKCHNMQCTFFEVTTAIAFLYFSENKVRYAVIEVGMGGQFDATNVIMPDVSAITDISIEHTEYLGKTIEEIAFEKAKIIKRKVPVVTSNVGKSLDVIMSVASEMESDVTLVDDMEVISTLEDRTIMRYKGDEYVIGIPGDYQAKNASVAIEVVLHLLCQNELLPHLKEGLKNVFWPCRMQKIKNAPIIVDVSHTKAGSKVLAENISRIYGKVVVVFGVLNDKDIDGILENISTVALEIIVTTPKSPRAADIVHVEEVARKYCKSVIVCAEINNAFRLALNRRNNAENILITGSFIMAEHVLEWLKKTSVRF